jgi:hypothetical protein
MLKLKSPKMEKTAVLTHIKFNLLLGVKQRNVL